MGRREEDDPLLPEPESVERDRRKQKSTTTVLATSVYHDDASQLELTVDAMLESDDQVHVERGMVFMRRVFALLVLQYLTILLVASPFTFVESFQVRIIHPYHNALEAVAVIGIVSSLVLAVFKGTTYPWARVALVGLTLSVALELGLSFATASWGRCGIVAVGQATTSFAVILALLQFETESLAWLDYFGAAIVCLVVSSLWMVGLMELGARTTVAVSILLGGWAFALINLYCCHHIAEQVAPEEYILATLFILVPEALVFLASKKRHPMQEEEKGATAESV